MEWSKTCIERFQLTLLSPKHHHHYKLTQNPYQGPFLKRPGNLTGPKSYFEIKISRKVGCVLTSNKVHFVYLADNFPVQLSKLLKLLSVTENKTT